MLSQETIIVYYDSVKPIEDIEQISRDTAGQIQSVSAATQEQSASAEEIASTSHTLAGLAQELQENTRKFRV